MTKTGKLHFGLKIMFMKEDFLITMEIMEWGGQVVKHSAAATGNSHRLF